MPMPFRRLARADAQRLLVNGDDDLPFRRSGGLLPAEFRRLRASWHSSRMYRHRRFRFLMPRLHFSRRCQVVGDEILFA